MSEEKRRSDRVIPVISEEEAVLVETGIGAPTLAKLIDFCEFGTLAYLLVQSGLDLSIGAACKLTLYNQGEVFTIASRIVRRNGHLVGFEFLGLSEDGLRSVKAKLNRMEVEWLRFGKPSSNSDSEPYETI